MFLDDIPRNKSKIDWSNCLEKKIYFIYEDIKDNFIIKHYNKHKDLLTIEYKNKLFNIKPYSITHCRISRILGIRTKEFKIEIGQIFKDEKRYLTIIDREYRKNKNGQDKKYYKYHCNKCGAELWAIESSLIINNHGCSCCNGKIVVKGINDIATTHPELVKYFVNVKDAYSHTYSSNKKVLMKCINCGYEKYISINNLSKKGFSCSKCSDKISYPEKFMLNLLGQLNIDFIYQYSKVNSVWCGKYKYDFYFKLNGEEYIIETHGVQHYKENSNFKMTLKEVQENDKNKKELATNNGINNNYIVLDCRKSELEFIKNNIINSRLNEIFDLNTIDWINIDSKSQKSLIKEVCDYWHLHNEINNEGLLVSDLKSIFNIHTTTIGKYLKIGNKSGWCNYDYKNIAKKLRSEISKSRRKPVEIFKDGKSLGIFPSCSELERKSEKLFGVKLNNSCITKVCRKEIQQYKGFVFKYVNTIIK